MRYGDIVEETHDEPHDLSDQLTHMVNSGQGGLIVARLATDAGMTPVDLVDFMGGAYATF
jgi:hypothetical protein